MKDSIYPSTFLKFWEVYPRREGKGSALKAYQNIKEPKPMLSEILSSINDHSNSKQWQNKEFIPHPATWLNQRRWEDEMDDVTPKPKILVFEHNEEMDK